MNFDIVIYSFFKSQGRELEPYRECEKNDKGEMECEDFERIMTGLELPGNNVWLGRGDAQTYMAVDKNKAGNEEKGYNMDGVPLPETVENFDLLDDRVLALLD